MRFVLFCFLPYYFQLVGQMIVDPWVNGRQELVLASQDASWQYLASVP